MSSCVEYEYVKNGFSRSGQKIPNIPIVNLLLHIQGREVGVRGPALVDTGYDRGIYANLAIANYLADREPIAKETLEAPGHPIECEVYAIKCRMVNDTRVDLGKVHVHVPINPADLADEPLIGREVLNRMRMVLNGEKLRVELRVMR